MSGKEKIIVSDILCYLQGNTDTVPEKSLVWVTEQPL